MGYVKPIREELVLNILNRFVQSDDVPFPFNLLLDGTLFPTPRSWIPVADT